MIMGCEKYDCAMYDFDRHRCKALTESEKGCPFYKSQWKAALDIKALNERLSTLGYPLRKGVGR